MDYRIAMDRTIKILKTFFWAPIIIAVLFVVLYETDVLLPGGLQMADQGQYMLLAIVELATLAAIPLTLYMFRVKSIKNQLTTLGAEALQRYGILRLMILGACVMTNTLFYYMTMTPSYGYMAIILVLAMTFIYPSRKRCEAEISTNPTQREE